MNGLVKRTNANILINFGLEETAIIDAKNRWNEYASEIGNTPLVTTTTVNDETYVAFETTSDIHTVFDTIIGFMNLLAEDIMFDDKTMIILRTTLSGIANNLTDVLTPTERIIYDGFKLAILNLVDDIDIGDGPLYTAVINAIDSAEAALISETPATYIEAASAATKMACTCATAIASNCNNIASGAASTKAITKLRQFHNTFENLTKLDNHVVLELTRDMADMCAEAYENHLIAQYASYDDSYA